MNKSDLRKLFYIDKNYSKIKEKLDSFSKSWSFNMLAKIELEQKNILEAYYYFDKAENVLGCAYCKLLQGEYEEAEILLRLIKNSSSFADWLLILLDLLKGREDVFISYFQIRNFFEQDLEMFFKYEKWDLVEFLIDKISYFELFNKEIYKYVARVFINNNYRLDYAKNFLQKSLDICYQDAETHFLFGDWYYTQNDYIMALHEYEKACEVNMGYLPAEKKIITLKKCLKNDIRIDK